MGKEWLKKQKKEKFYQQAKKEGIRSRAAYKLKHIQAKYRILNGAKLILDLGCAPGGWIQEIKREFASISIVGIDLVEMQPIEDVIFIQGDIQDDSIFKILEEKLSREVDTLISDCAPKITGMKETDYARQIFLVERVLKIADRFLIKGGHFVCKLFDGIHTTKIRDQLKQNFEEIDLFKPEASRKKSAELYLIGKNYKKTNLILDF